MVIYPTLSSSELSTETISYADFLLTSDITNMLSFFEVPHRFCELCTWQLKIIVYSMGKISKIIVQYFSGWFGVLF